MNVYNSKHTFQKSVNNSTIYSHENDFVLNNCGIFSQLSFSIDSDLDLESLKFNNCLNKKMCIDKNGFIHNCPSMKKNYGSIEDISLIKVLKNTNFKSIWGVKKDNINVCKVCEYRYICTDCRAFNNLDSLNSKPIKCNYDPHTTKWN